VSEASTWSAVWVGLSQVAAWTLFGAVMYTAWKVRGYVVNREWTITRTVGNITQVVERLAELRSALGADRACVFQFHNGDYFINGSPILRMSCTHESVAPGVAGIKVHSRDIMVNHVVESLEFLQEFDRTSLPSVLDITGLPECFYKSAVLSQGVETVVQYPLYKEEHVVGLVGVSFHKQTNPKQHLLSRMKELAPHIEYLVNNEESKGWFSSLWEK